MTTTCAGGSILIASRKEANAQARQMFEKALELDPQYAEAYAFLGSPTFRPCVAVGSGPSAS